MSARPGPSNRPIVPLPARRAPANRPLLGRRSRGGASANAIDAYEDESFDLPCLPAGPYESSDAGMEAETDNDDVKVLEAAPEHLRKITNEANPYTIDDSDDEAGPATKPRVTSPLSPAKRERDTPALDDDGWEIPDGDYSGLIDVAEEQPAAKRPRIECATAADFLADVLDIIPDLDIDTALATLQSEIEGGRMNECVERTIGSMLEMVEGYPKAKVVDAKGKAKEIEEHPDLYRDKTYRRVERLGPGYHTLSQIDLEKRFVQVSIKDIRTQFAANQRLFVPSYFALHDLLKMDNSPFTLLRRPRATDKGKGRVETEEDQSGDPLGTQRGSSEFYLERAFLDSYIAKTRVEADELEVQRLSREMALANGEGIECGCCFGEETWDAIFQCSEGHLFCRVCVKIHAETKLGEQKTRIDCMDGSGCAALFPESELQRLLSEKSLHLYHRLKQNAELAEAGIDGLESCPGCDYAAVIDNPEEKLFRCMNQSCMRVSCRKCQKPDHIPKTCEEAESDKKLDKRHAVEEAMTDALIRKCPKCTQPYLKEHGCNKILCSKCHTMSCYVCQKQITGYEHFDHGPGGPNPGGRGKCLLHDNEEAAKDHRAVIAARDAAQQGAREAARQQGLELADADIDVAAPDQPAGRPGVLYGLNAPHVGMAGRFHVPAYQIGRPLVADYPQPPALQVAALARPIPEDPVFAGRMDAIRQRLQDDQAQMQRHDQRRRGDAARVQDAVAQWRQAAVQPPHAPGNHLGRAQAMIDALAPQRGHQPQAGIVPPLPREAVRDR